MTLMDMLQSLVANAKAAETDLMKFENGNTAAGIRARAIMQEVRQRAKKIRAEIQKIRKQRKAEKSDTQDTN